MNLGGKVIVVGIFFAAAALLLFYLLSMSWHIYLPTSLFWLAIALMLITITFQCLKMELSPLYTRVVLLEIVVTCFVFHMIYQVPYYGLRGYDVYMDMASVKGILSSGFVMGDPLYINDTSVFPMIHIFGAIFSLVSGINLSSVVKWIPSLLDLSLILSLYLLVRSVCREEKIALLSALLFACLDHHMLFSSLFVRQTLALVLTLCCIYLYFSATQSRNPTANYALSIVCLIGTVFTHHLTSFMLLTFLFIHFLVTKATTVSSLRTLFFGDTVTGEKVTGTFIAIAFTAIFTYWLNVTTFPLYTLTTFLRSVFTPSEWWVQSYSGITGFATSIQTIRGYIEYYGFYTFHIIFALILLNRLLRKEKNRRIELYSYTLFLFFCGLMGFVSLYFLVTGAFPDRFLMFGWLFGFMPLVFAILKSKNKWPRRVGVFLLVAFMFFNIYSIKPVTWNPQADGIPAVTSEEDYSLANTINFSIGEIFGHQNALMAIYDVHNNLGDVLSFSEEDLTKFDWIIVQKKVLDLEKKYYSEPRTETLAAWDRLITEPFPTYNKLYESDNLVVFRRIELP